jgi:hypothetical protein
MKNTKKNRRKWSIKYKKSINCNHPKGFSQRQYFKYVRTKKNRIRNNKKQSWTWSVNGVNAKELLLLFYPYLGKRRKEK